MHLPEGLVARYEPIRPLGEGGMGRVIAVRDRLLERPVALKLLRTDRRPEEGRLREEFTLLAALDHPGVVRVHDVGLAGELLYLTADLVEGSRLDRWLDLDPSDELVAGVLADILGTLSWLHGVGVVHADLKPQNILLLTAGGRPWPVLIDFGLAHAAGYPGTGEAPLGGTLEYMAPELLAGRGRRPDALTDLFSLGRCFRRWLERHPESTLAGLLGTLAAQRADDRPASAEAALAGLPGARTPRRHIGARGVAALWGPPLEACAAAVDGLAGARLARVPAPEDVRSFVGALKAALEVRGRAALVAPRAEVGVELWQRLLACLAGEAPELGGAGSSPEDHREALEAFAQGAIDALRGVEGELPTLIVGAPERLPEASRYVLARVIEAEVIARLVLVTDAAAEVRLARGVERDLASLDVAPPDAGRVAAFLDAHGVVDVPDEAMHLLVARAVAGPAALRVLLEVWVDVGALVPDAGGWRWSGDAAAMAIDAPDLDAVWRRLWHRLPDEGRAMVGHVAALGGVAALDWLAALAGESAGALRARLERLVAEGWLETREGGGVALAAPAAARIADGRVEVPEVGREARLGYVRLLGRAKRARQLEALAGHLGALGRHDRASSVWERAARAYAASFAPARAGRAALAAARELAAADAAGEIEVMALAEAAVRHLVAAGDPQGRSEALQLARQAAEALGTDDAALALTRLEARLAIDGARPGAALAAVERAEGLLEGRMVVPRIAFELALARGVARSQQGAEDAAESLSEAAELAAGLGDDQAFGRVSNNLGILYFNRGEFGRAADAWRRTAEAKRRCRDLRGERIAEANRGLALREQGALAEAWRCARRSLEMAERTGDRSGRVTGRLALAQVALDVGAVEVAEESARGAREVPIASAMVSADVEMVGLRCALASGRFGEAADRAWALYQTAREGLKPIEREAWGWWYLAATQAGRLIEGALETARALLDDAGGHASLLSAALAHALAREGEWGPAREMLAAAEAEQRGETVAPGRVAALGLLHSTAKVVGDKTAEAALRAAAAATLDARLASARELGLEVERGALARALGLSFAHEDQGDREARNVHGGRGPAASDSGDEARARSGTSPSTSGVAPTMSAAQHTTLQTLGGLSSEAWGAPEAWARALMRVTRARACRIVALGEGGAASEDIAEVGEADEGSGERWREVVSGLKGRPKPFVAEGERGLEAFGAALRVEAGADEAEDPAAGLLLTWSEEGPAESASALRERLSEALKLAALAVDRHVKVGALRAAERALEEAEARHKEALAASRAEVTQLRDELEQSRSELMLRYDYSQIVHESRPMKRVLATLDKITERDLPVLVMGESGVGKELLARAIHYNGPRRGGPFVAENCGAVPGEIFESVFFGHVRGAFTGAHSTQKGLLDAAKGGTLFLDEVGELRPEHQVKLLRVLQERRFRPVGGRAEIEADFRLVAATNRNLLEMIEEGTFREDLYYRLAVVTIRVPPLRERPADVLPLAQHFLGLQSERLGQALSLSAEAAEILSAYGWPGNVRELENEMLRASVLCDGGAIRPVHLSPRVLGRGPRGSESAAAAATLLWDGEESLEAVVSRVEARVIERALKKTRGKKAPAARLLGLSRPGLDGKIKRYGVDAEGIRERARAQARGDKE